MHDNINCHPYSYTEHSKSMRKTEARYPTEATYNEGLDQALTSLAETMLESNPWGSDPSVILKKWVP